VQKERKAAVAVAAHSLKGGWGKIRYRFSKNFYLLRGGRKNLKKGKEKE